MNHPDLILAMQLAYQPQGLSCQSIEQEAESKEYGACTFILNTKNVIFRVANITPTKSGHFVTIWKRINSSPIMPYDLNDAVDLFVISVRKDDQFGQFIFPKEILHKKGFVSQNGNGGKRAMRVYPPWSLIESVQAQKTQAWQLLYFIEITPRFDAARLRYLLERTI